MPDILRCGIMSTFTSFEIFHHSNHRHSSIPCLYSARTRMRKFVERYLPAYQRTVSQSSLQLDNCLLNSLSPVPRNPIRKQWDVRLK